jgi:hypothetical protein
MNTFKDRDGGEWIIDLTIGAVDRVRRTSENEFDLLDPQAGSTSKEDADRSLSWRLYTDSVLLWRVLWCLVEPQARKREIDAERFGELMAADCIVDAQAQFFEAWNDFFLRLQQPEKALLLEKLTKYHKRAVEVVAQNIADAKPSLDKLDERVERSLQSSSKAKSGELLAALDSILADIPLDSSG